MDRYGNENNLYDPKVIVRTTERKAFKSKKRDAHSHNHEEVNSI